MPSYIVKAHPDRDLYVEWSTVVDAPIRWGRASDFPPPIPADRKARADSRGTSSIDGFYDWDQKTLIVANMGDGDFYQLPRSDIDNFLSVLEDDPEDRDQQQHALNMYAQRMNLGE
jgi:hypothetical protein